MKSQPRFNTKYLIPAMMFFILGACIFATLALAIFYVYRIEELHNAIRNDDINRVEQLLDKKPHLIEQRSRLDLTPLLEAAWDGRADVIRVLVHRGADLNAKWNLVASGDGGWNALHIASLHGQEDAAKVLIESGIDINCKSIKGETPLDVANRNGQKKIASLLQQHGAKTGDAR